MLETHARPSRSAAARAVLVLLLAACAAPERDVSEDPAATRKVAPAAPRPNVVVILADDLGYGDVAALNPSSRIPTPHLDRLAAEGLSYVDAHTPSSVCTPTRYGLLTGRYCWRGRLKQGVIDGYGAPVMEPGRQTLATVLKSAGYHTAMVGKWHLGLTWSRIGEAIDFAQPVEDGPGTFGFDESLILPASLDFPPYVYVEDGRVTAEAVVRQEKQPFPAYLRPGPRGEDVVMEDVLDDLTSRAVRHIRERAEERAPFFLYFALTAPHKPVLPHPRFHGRTELGDYGDFVVQVDWSVGEVLRALDEAGVAEDTLVVFTSDNGSFMYRYDDDKVDHTQDVKVQGYRAANHRANGALRGTKADVFEGGHRVPFLVRWPAELPAGEAREKTICLTDVLATCAEVAGAEVDAEQAQDSFSFLSSARDPRREAPRDAVVHHSARGMFAVRKGAWKLVLGNGSGGREKPAGEPFGRPYQLFNLTEDPSEERDLAAVHPDIVAFLERQLESVRTGKPLYPY